MIWHARGWDELAPACHGNLGEVPLSLVLSSLSSPWLRCNLGGMQIHMMQDQEQAKVTSARKHQEEKMTDRQRQIQTTMPRQF